MTKTKYPFFNEKGSIHLMKTMFKDGLVYLSEGGDLSKRKHVSKHDFPATIHKNIQTYLLQHNM